MRMDIFSKSFVQGSNEDMMKNAEKIRENICLAGIVLLITAGAVLGGWKDIKPKFQSVTVDVGTQTLEIDPFLTEYASAEQASFVTDPETVNLNAVGEQSIQLQYGSRTETVTLTIQDTMAPQLSVQDLTLPLGTELTAEAFVTDLFDHSDVTLEIVKPAVVPVDYSAQPVEIIATDSCGNQSRATCTVEYVWMREAVVLEYGQQLNAEDLLYDAARDSGTVSREALDQINSSPLGEYEITSTIGDRSLTCKVTVQDTQGPELKLKEHQSYYGYSVFLYQFVESATDPSGEVTVTMITEPDVLTMGVQTIVIEAVDIYGNVTTAETKLYIASDFYPPVIYGVQPLSVEKHGTIDYLANVYAVDGIDGYVEVSCDSGMVDLTKAGTYYITYTARDSSGNLASTKCQVSVMPDEADTQALVVSIANTLGNDPEALRDYVRSTIAYNHEWGGANPVWYGFTTRGGNCYVHAMCLKAIFDLKGINNQLIWVTDKSHYWLLVEIDGAWRHIDPTPSSIHGLYSLMTDDLRYATLSGRDWDRSAWPKCE